MSLVVVSCYRNVTEKNATYLVQNCSSVLSRLVHSTSAEIYISFDIPPLNSSYRIHTLYIHYMLEVEVSPACYKPLIDIRHTAET